VPQTTETVHAVQPFACTVHTCNEPLPGAHWTAFAKHWLLQVGASIVASSPVASSPVASSPVASSPASTAASSPGEASGPASPWSPASATVDPLEEPLAAPLEEPEEPAPEELLPAPLEEAVPLEEPEEAPLDEPEPLDDPDRPPPEPLPLDDPDGPPELLPLEGPDEPPLEEPDEPIPPDDPDEPPLEEPIPPDDPEEPPPEEPPSEDPEEPPLGCTTAASPASVRPLSSSLTDVDAPQPSRKTANPAASRDRTCRRVTLTMDLRLNTPRVIVPAKGQMSHVRRAESA
jgi:hypothetical protein